MPYLLDTDWFIDYLDGLPQAVRLVGSLVADGVSISVITYIEVYQGVYRRQSTAAEQALAAARSPVQYSLAVLSALYQ